MGSGRNGQGRTVPRDSRRGYIRQLHILVVVHPIVLDQGTNPKRGDVKEAERRRGRQLRYYEPIQSDTHL